MADLRAIRARLIKASAAYDSACAQVKREKLAMAEASQQIAYIDEAQALVQDVSQSIQNRVHQQIASVVAKCLTAVFGETAYSFRVDFQKARGKTEANLWFVRDGKDIDPMSASGGGAVDVASFALRLACIMLSRPRKRRLLVADEIFKFLSKEYRPKVRALLEQLADELDFQFLFVTHSSELACGKVIAL